MNTFHSEWFDAEVDKYFFAYAHPPQCAMMSATMFWYYFEGETIPRAFYIYNSRVHGPIIIRPSPYLIAPTVIMCSAEVANRLAFNALYEDPAPIEADYAGWALGPDDAPMPTI